MRAALTTAATALPVVLTGAGVAAAVPTTVTPPEVPGNNPGAIFTDEPAILRPQAPGAGHILNTARQFEIERVLVCP